MSRSTQPLKVNEQKRRYLVRYPQSRQNGGSGGSEEQGRRVWGPIGAQKLFFIFIFYFGWGGVWGGWGALGAPFTPGAKSGCDGPSYPCARCYF